MDAQEILTKIRFEQPISEDYFNQLKKEFQKEYLFTKKYNEMIDKHRHPIEVKGQVLRGLYDYLQLIQNRDVMRDLDPDRNASGHAPTIISEIWKSDKSLKTCYDAIREYCKLRNKDFNVIAIHIAEYRAMSKLADKIKRSIRKDEINKMPKNFEIEIREMYDTLYLKIIVREGIKCENVVQHLSVLNSIKRASVTVQKSGKKDITIYPQKAFDVKEVAQEIDLALRNYFSGNPDDPVFISNIISSISDQAYYQILDYIILLGKNLEAFKDLNVKFDEERYRDYFIPFLNSISTQHSAKGEVFNKKGKTDILVFDNDGNNIFIAECKLWKGEVYLLNAVNQLYQNYVNWRDEKTSIIIFNRDVKKFSQVIETATRAISTHPLCLKVLGQRQLTSYSYLFRHPEDNNKTSKFELVLLNFV